MASHNQKLSDDEFIKLFPMIGAQGISEQFGVAVVNVYSRRRRLEKAYDILLESPSTLQSKRQTENVRRTADVKNGTIIIGSDAHKWKEWTTAQLAFVDVAKKLQPKIVILNGDVLDGASISRHPPINWETIPTLEEEMRYVADLLDRIEDAAPKAKRYWLLGNHDARFESRLAKEAPEFRGVKGVHLKDHFPKWIPGMSLWINDEIVVKHRFKGGVHAAHNNTVNAGKTIVTGHTHQQKITPWTDYNGTRYGIECGTMAEPYGPQFMYAEDNPKSHISGFVVLTIKDGEMLYPEVVRAVEDGVYEFRGERHKVKV